RVMTVIKTRSRKHSSDLRTYEITERGIVVGGPLADYQGIISGVPQLRRRDPPAGQAGLTDQEATVLQVLIDMHQGGERELAQRTGLQRGVLAGAQAAYQATAEFLAGLSHEQRTPLNASLGWTHMLRRGSLKAAAVDRALAVIERNAMLQMQLISDLLQVSQVISGKLRLDVQP